jgi:hypothetical protein
MIGNQVVSTMFDFNTYNHMARFVLRDDINEDPGSYHFDPGCDGVFMICIDTYIHFVCLVAMSKFESFYSIYPQCILGGYADSQ